MSKKKPTADDLIAFAKARKERDLTRQGAELQNALNIAHEHVSELERRLELMSDIDAAAADLTPARVARKGQTRSGDKRVGAAFTVASDWHVEERVDPKVVQGLNEYNPTIAAKRIERYFQGLEWLILENRQSHTLNELWVAALGDFITGYIHEELLESNFSSPLQAIEFWLDHFERGLRYLINVVPDLTIKVACRFGNHGRTTPKTRIATAAANSFEWFAYCQLRKMLRDVPQIQVQVTEGHHSVVEIYNLRVHLHHGDSIRSQGGIGGIDVPLNRAVAQWRNKYKTDLSVVGHFHRFQMGERLITNGSLIGYGAYSDWLPGADPEPAQQAFCIFDARRGKCKNTPIWVGESK